MSLDYHDQAVIRQEGQDIRTEIKNQTEIIQDTNRLLRNVVSELIKLNSKLTVER